MNQLAQRPWRDDAGVGVDTNHDIMVYDASFDDPRTELEDPAKEAPARLELDLAPSNEGDPPPAPKGP